MIDDFNNEGFTGRLVRAEGGYKLLLIIVILMLLAGTGWSGYQFKQFVDLSQEEPITLPPVKGQSEKDSERLDTLIGDFRGAVDTRARSLTLASAVIEASRQPFMATQKAPEPGELAAGSGGQVTVEGGEAVPTFVREKIPPIMFVRAIMVAGNQSMAVMDIEGVGNGIIVKSGYRFANGAGRVVRIRPDKVTVNWSGKTVDVAPGL